MNRSMLLVVLGIFLVAENSPADVIFTTSTLDSATLDFDGAGSVTNGSLGVSAMQFVISGSNLPTTTEFENITSLTITFGASAPAAVAELSSRAGGIIPPGIGVFSSGETIITETGSLNNQESISIDVSSTSTNGDVVELTGVVFNDWRNFFPVSQVSLSGATFGGGQTELIGANGSSPTIPIMLFDNGVGAFSVTSTGAPVRIENIRLRVTNSSVPEPGIIGFLGFAGMAFALNRRRSR